MKRQKFWEDGTFGRQRAAGGALVTALEATKVPGQ